MRSGPSFYDVFWVPWNEEVVVMQEQIDGRMMEHEARLELLDMARGRVGAVPPEVLVDQVMAVTAGRLGQKRPIDVYNLVSQNSIEARIAGLVADKKALFSSLFDGSSDEVRFDRSGSFLSQLERVVEPVAGPEVEDADLQQEETSLGREIEAMVTAADESTDPRPRKAAEPAAPQEPAPKPSAGAPAGAPVDIQRLFSSLTIRSTAEGGFAIEAPPESASTLASVFEGMARLLRGQG
jgi:hypothetical protein